MSTQGNTSYFFIFIFCVEKVELPCKIVQLPACFISRRLTESQLCPDNVGTVLSQNIAQRSPANPADDLCVSYTKYSSLLVLLDSPALLP